MSQLCFLAPGVPSWLTGGRKSHFRCTLRVHRARSASSVAIVQAVVSPVRASESIDMQGFDEVVMKTYGRYPIEMSRGSGALIWDTEGREYIDCVAGIATCSLGHGDERLVQAVTDQMRKLNHVSNLYYIPEQGRLARWLVERSPADKAFFCNSGAEANEAAFKLARKYFWETGKGEEGDPVIITADNSFHGRTLAAITATGQTKYQKGFSPLMPGFVYVKFNDVTDLNRVADEVGPRLAGIMLEALQGEGGVNPGKREFFAAAREICDQRDALLMFDEVQVGMGRTGKLWGFEKLGVEPDVVTTAKGLGGGVPIGAMLSKEKFSVFKPGDHASTFGGNPLASAAALAVCTALEEDGVMLNAANRGEQIRQGIKSIANKFPEVVKEVRGWGLINGVELEDGVPFSSGDIVKAGMDNGLLLVPAGPKVVRFVPPLVITEEQVKSALSKFEAAVAKVTSLVSL